MEITTEIDNLHFQKLNELKEKFSKTTSELISLAIDEIYKSLQNDNLTEGKKAFRIMKDSGFVGNFEDDGNLSEDYKNYLDWSDKI